MKFTRKGYCLWVDYGAIVIYIEILVMNRQYSSRLPRWHSGIESFCQSRREETQVPSLDWEDALEEEMATCSRILAGKPHGKRSLGLQSQTQLSTCVHTHTHTQYAPIQRAMVTFDRIHFANLVQVYVSVGLGSGCHRE